MSTVVSAGALLGNAVQLSNQIECWFQRRGKNWITRRKTSQSRVENRHTRPTCDAESGNRTRGTSVGSECSRLQNSRIFCERKRRGKYSNDGRVRRARFTREDHAYGASRLPKMEENDCFAVYECSHHCAIPAFLKSVLNIKFDGLGLKTRITSFDQIT